MLREGGVSVVMVSYHTGAVLIPAIQLVLSQPGLSELVLVDNGNPPEVQTRLRAMSSNNPKMVLVSGQGNVGFARGCNLGASYANGFYLLLLNPDCLLPENALERLVFALEMQPSAVLAGARLLNVDGTQQRGCWREVMNPKNAICEALGIHKTRLVSQLNNHEMSMPDHSFVVPAISGACMFIRAEDYTRFKGLDEGYFLHVEDMDFCKRVRDSGANIIIVPAVTPTHLLSTSDAPSRFVEWQKNKGFFRYFRTHYPRSPLAWIACAGALARYMVRAYIRPPKTSARMVALGVKTLLLISARTLPAKKRFAGKRVLVTGATCPLGLVTVGRLLAEGAQVMAISRAPELAYNATNLSWHAADLHAANVMLPDGADFIIHCAPLWTLSNALPAIKRSGVNKIIAFGSTSIYGKEGSRNAEEKKAFKQLSAAEMESRERCKLLALPLVILRPTMIYGSGTDGNVSRVARTIRRFGRFPIAKPACGMRQPVHMLDLAEAAMSALLSSDTREHAYNVSGGETLTYRAMVERIFITLQKPVKLLAVPFLPQLLDASGRLLQKSINGDMARRMNSDLVFPHDAATRDFGYAPRAFLTGGIKDLNGELL